MITLIIIKIFYPSNLDENRRSLRVRRAAVDPSLEPTGEPARLKLCTRFYARLIALTFLNDLTMNFLPSTQGTRVDSEGDVHESVGKSNFGCGLCLQLGLHCHRETEIYESPKLTTLCYVTGLPRFACQHCIHKAMQSLADEDLSNVTPGNYFWLPLEFPAWDITAPLMCFLAEQQVAYLE